MMTIEKIKKYAYENIDLLDLVNEINCWDGSLENLQVYENDEEFFSIYFDKNPMEVARAITYGDYHYMDDYVGFNGYGNLISYTKYEVDEMMKNNFNEIFDRMLDVWENLYLDCDLQEMLEEMEGDE